MDTQISIYNSWLSSSSPQKEKIYEKYKEDILAGIYKVKEKNIKVIKISVRY